MTLGQSCSDMPQEATTVSPVVICQGRALSADEVLGLSGAPAPRRALTLVLSGWIGLLLVASDPLAGIATLFAAPIVLSWMLRRDGQRDSFRAAG